jgi:hypothetical protein
MQGGASGSVGVASGALAPDELSALLQRLDWQLGEVGRRDHRFAWLRDADGAWAAVASYYPSHQVVVVAPGNPELIERCRTAVEGRGMRLLVAGPRMLETDASRPVTAAVEPPPVASVAGGPEADGGEIARKRATPAAGFALGLTLIVIVIVECYLGFVALGIDDGDLILGFGLVLDAGARAAGLVASLAVGDTEAAWSSVLIGSPALCTVTSEEAAARPPLAIARVAGLIAAVVVVVGLLVAVL